MIASLSPSLFPDDARSSLRPADEVMDLRRLGSLHQSRLSFVRSLVRRMSRDRWTIRSERFELDDEGFGDAVYAVDTPDGRFSFVVFTQPLDPAQRTDRVIAERWDLACALVEGRVAPAQLDELRENVPRQEAGRCDSRVLVLSRANRSQRNFEAILGRLAAGTQPDPQWIAEVGYLYRTTAVYGNGKFGIADYARLRDWPAFDRPFSAQMFAVFMVRHFSLQQIGHMARRRAPDRAVPLDRNIARYLGIGNSTGLGMAPFLISHPKLINQWVLCRETALARVLARGRADGATLERFAALTGRAVRHLGEIHTADERQRERDAVTRRELAALARWTRLQRRRPDDGSSAPWARLLQLARRHWSLQTQELVVSLLLEIHPHLVDDLENDMATDESYDLAAEMPVAELIALTRDRYHWALAYDFKAPQAQRYFWYRSAEKEEPRLGERALEPGADREMALGIAREVCRCFDSLTRFAAADSDAPVVEFLLRHPEHRGIVRRIQNIAPLAYGEIRGNLLSADCEPIDLLRCKLSFFGASKFDPRGDRWVRITLFQGAPLTDELNGSEPDWFLPVMPERSA